MSAPTHRMRAAMGFCVARAGFAALVQEVKRCTTESGELYGEVFGLAFAEAEKAYDDYQLMVVRPDFLVAMHPHDHPKP